MFAINPVIILPLANWKVHSTIGNIFLRLTLNEINLIKYYIDIKLFHKKILNEVKNKIINDEFTNRKTRNLKEFC